MKDQDEFLYTDIALQLFNVFADSNKNEPAENRKILSTLFESLQEDYSDNEFFLPALLYAFMTHLNIVFNSIAEVKDVSVDDIRSSYIQHYNEDIRPLLRRNMINVPSRHQDVLDIISSANEIDEE